MNQYDFHARGLDTWNARFSGVDPVDNVSLSGYASMNNNPVSYIDPDGRSPAVIGAAIGAVSYTLQTAFSKGGFKNWNWMKFGISTISGAVFGGISAGIGESASQIANAGARFAVQTGAHSVLGGLNSGINGGGFKSGLISGGVGSIWGSATGKLGSIGQIGGSALFSGVSSELTGGNFWQGAAIGGITSGLNHYLHKLPPKGTYVKYDGNKLYVFRNGKLIYTIDAYSGAPQSDGSFNYSIENQKVAMGPIPEGEYTIEPFKSQSINPVDDIVGTWGKALGLKLGGWPGGVIAWGNSRIWINGSNYDRSGFSIHGGYVPGSAGCIDVCKNIATVVSKIQSSAHTTNQSKIPLIVKY